MLARNPRRWNQATGPISATICWVLEARWRPSSPGFWKSPDGSATLDALFNKAQIIDSFSSDMEMQTWKAAARHSSSSGLEKGIITDFAKKARSQLIKEGSFTAARALNFLVCGAINEPHLPADGSIPNQFLCVRCDQKVLATRKHELWECPGNTSINHTHMRKSEYLTLLAQEFWDTDQVLFARGLLPRDWLPVSELAECNEVKMWESVDFSACARNHVLFGSDGSGRSSPNTETGRIWSGHFRHAPQQRHLFHSAANWLSGRSGARQADGSTSRTLGSHPNSQQSRWEDEHPNSDRCEIRDERHCTQR